MVTPTGPLAIAVDALRTLLASVPFFQIWTGAADATAALASIFTGEVGFPIASVSIAGGVATVTTTEPHGLSSGAVVEIAGASLGGQTAEDLDGPRTLTAVTSTTLSFTTALADQASIYPDQAIVLPSVRPLAVVCEADDGLRAVSIGTGGASIYTGVLDVLFEADVSAGYVSDPLNALYEARNALGGLVQGLAETQGTADLMVLDQIEPSMGPQFTRRDEQDAANRFERWRAMVRCTWGVTS